MRQRLYRRLFVDLWPVWIGGAILGATNAIYALAASRVAGAWGPWRNFASWLEVKLLHTHLFAKVGFSPDISIGVMAVSMVAGSFIASVIGKDFIVRKSNHVVLWRGFFGGILIAIGASVAQGCTVYHFMGGIPSLLFGSLLFFVGVYSGIYVGVRFMQYLTMRRL